VLIVDNSSDNGTFVNADRITWKELKNGDTVRAGPFILLAEIPAGETLASGPAADIADAQGPADRDAPALHSGSHRLYPREYLEGIDHFNAGRYFEAHESWEQVWLRSSGEDKMFYQMLIQAAVGLHHFQRSNWTGARGMYRRVSEKVAVLPAEYMSLDLKIFASQFSAVLRALIEDDIESPQPAIPLPVIELSGQP